jgi:hypothetical protein
MRDHIVDEMEHAEEAAHIEEGLRAFVRVLEEGRMDIRAFPTPGSHSLRVPAGEVTLLGSKNGLTPFI